MPNITIKFDLVEDAINWWEAGNKISHGVVWKDLMKPELQDRIVGKTKEEALEFLFLYLGDYYKNRNLEDYTKEIQAGFDSIKDSLFSRMESVTGHPIYRSDFTLFITSFNRFPYNYDQGYVWISDRGDIDKQVGIFIHELLHFQYFAYFGERIWKELGPKLHGEIKEAMTVILNEEFKDITSVRDKGYLIHREMRDNLLKIWQKERNMERFIEQTIKFYKS